MNLSTLSISELTSLLTDAEAIDYLTAINLTKLFNLFGSRDDCETLKAEGNFGSRATYTKRKLIEINGLIHLKHLLEHVVDDRVSSNPLLKVEAINKIIKYDNYLLEKNAEGIFKITGKDLPENVVVTPVFEDIEKQVIQHINSAKYSIWVAVAWITSRSILKALYKQHLNGLNVRIVVNDDETTAKYGLPIERTGIEYYKVAPRNEDFKNTMHHKFCVIDLKKVVTGSFNWTMKASFNNENITIIEQREKSELYANEFLKLIAPFKGKRKGH